MAPNEKPKPPSRVIIVGAGWYGLAAAKTYLTLYPDCSVTILDGDSTVGGVWSCARLYPNLYAQITYPLFEYPDFPMPKVGLTPEGYISGQTIHDYLHAYAVHFGVLPRVQFRRWVEAVHREDEGRDWVLRVKNMDTQTVSELRCDKLVIANGPTSTAKLPAVPRSSFTPPAIHSKDLGISLPALSSDAVKTVTIVGAAKSAYDAVFLAMERGKHVQWLMRGEGAGPIVMYPPRYLRLVNIMDLASMRLTSKMSPDVMAPEGDLWEALLHRSLLGRAFVRCFWGLLGSMNNWYAGYGRSENANKLRPKPDSSFWCNNGLGCMSVGMQFWEMFHSGLCTVTYGNLESLEGRRVVLKDGTWHETDFVVFCTGWNDDIPMFDADTARGLGIPSRVHQSPPTAAELAADAAADAAVDARFPLLAKGPGLSPKAESKQRSWKLWRKIVPPSYAARGDRSIVFLGQIHSIGTAMVAGMSTLWAVSYLEGELETPDLAEMEREAGEWDAWTRKRYLDAGKKFPYCIYDFVPYIDNLVRDMGLRVARKSTMLKEFIEPYGPRDYKDIYSEWTAAHPKPSTITNGKASNGTNGKASNGTTNGAALTNGKATTITTTATTTTTTAARSLWLFYTFSAFALFALWLVPAYHGMIHHMVSQTFLSEPLSPGQPLLVHYTGIYPLDRILALLVMFFYPVTFSQDRSIHIMLLEVVPTLFSMSIYMTIDSYRPAYASRGILTRHAWIWGVGYQLFGGAVIFPLWAAYNLSQPQVAHNNNKKKKTTGAFAIPLRHAQVLPISFALGALLPAWLLLQHLDPIAAGRSSETHQQLLALYQCAPILFAALQYILGTTLQTLFPPSKSATAAKNSDLKYLHRMTLLPFLVCTATHLLTLNLARDAGMGMVRQVYGLPWQIEPAAGMQACSSFFLRWDGAIIAATLVTWAYLACFRGLDLVMMAMIVPLYALTGAGGVMAVAWLAREWRIRGGKVE